MGPAFRAESRGTVKVEHSPVGQERQRSGRVNLAASVDCEPDGVEPARRRDAAEGVDAVDDEQPAASRTTATTIAIPLRRVIR